MPDKITIQTGAQPTREEIMTANFLVAHNKKATVRFLAPANIFNLRQSKMSDAVNVAKLEKELKDIKKVKRLIVITKSHKMLDFTK